VHISSVIIGGGPAGAVAGRLLASWGHRVLVLERQLSRPLDGSAPRGLAESIPPSARKLLAEVGVLDAVDAASFYQFTGNTVWWGHKSCRVEPFEDGANGLQVFRPDFDRVLLDAAETAGADVWRGARVLDVVSGNDGARIEVEYEGRRATLTAPFVLDCSGRSGVVARRHRMRGVRAYALTGVWRTTARWDLPDGTHTAVEAFDRGWAWSIPISATVRHAGVMIEAPPARDGVSLSEAYRAELARATNVARHLEPAALEDVWAFDASTYSATSYTSRHALLVGDAGSFIDPLSSFGVKKAIASAWIAAVTTNTCLRDERRRPAAMAFFDEWSRDVDARYAAQSREHARAAAASHHTPFWTARANVAVSAPASVDVPESSLREAFRQIQSRDELDVVLDARVACEPHAIIRGHEIVMEDSLPGGVRFHQNVDLLALARLAGQCRRVPDLFDAYCRERVPVPLPNVLAGLSLLVARGFLIPKDARCQLT